MHITHTFQLLNDDEPGNELNFFINKLQHTITINRMKCSSGDKPIEFVVAMTTIRRRALFTA